MNKYNWCWEPEFYSGRIEIQIKLKKDREESHSAEFESEVSVWIH